MKRYSLLQIAILQIAILQIVLFIKRFALFQIVLLQIAILQIVLKYIYSMLIICSGSVTVGVSEEASPAAKLLSIPVELL